MSKNICLAFDSEAHYEQLVDSPMRYRHFLAAAYSDHPELFPAAWKEGFTFHNAYHSAKEQVIIRRVKLKASGDVSARRPSFLMPYMTARTDEVEKALYLLPFGVPFAALAYVFGRDGMF